VKRYVTMRILFVVFNVFLLGTLLFFALTFANFNVWASMPPSESYPIILRLYRVFLEQRILAGDWGLTASGDLVREVVVPRFWITMRYNLIALAVYTPVGIAIGAISAYYKDSLFDRVFNTLTLVFGSIPMYILIFILIIVLGFQLGWFPPHRSYIPGTFWGSVWGLGIPILALSAGAVSKISRVVRYEMIDTLQSDYVLLAKTKGLTKGQIFARHLLKNSIVSVFPVMMDVFLLVLMGSFFVEMSFGIHGVAELLYEAIVGLYPELEINFIAIDVNTIVIICTFYMLVAFVFGLFVDLMHHVVDPRINVTH